MHPLSRSEHRVITVCLKWVPTSPEIDPLTGEVRVDQRFSGLSPADRAALEWALRTAEVHDVPVEAVTVGPEAADAALSEAVAHGARRATRVHVAQGYEPGSRSVAAGLASVAERAGLVFCGNHSLDRGSGAVPAFLAHELGYGQALGCVRLLFEGPSDGPGLVAERRLDQGRRERLAIEGPTVLSFEGGLELRRASLGSTMTASEATITVIEGSIGSATEPDGPVVLGTGPYRPRPRVLAPPRGSTVDRVQQLTGVGEERQASQQLELDPSAAADAVIDQLETWGYLDRPDPDTADTPKADGPNNAGDPNNADDPNDDPSSEQDQPDPDAPNADSAGAGGSDVGAF